MREELERLLSKEVWDEEDLEDLEIIFEGKLGKELAKLQPDIAELVVKELARGRGSTRKRIERAYLMSGIAKEVLKEFFELPKVSSEPQETFPDLIERARKTRPWELDEGLLEDLRVAAELSERFKAELAASTHPYICAVTFSKKTKPLVVDGSNFLWKHDLDPTAFEELFLSLSELKPTYFPVYIVFDANVEHVVPSSSRGFLKVLLASSRVYRHSPADELILALAREKSAHVISEDRFKEYDTRGLTILDFPL